jgi:aldo/keto reductase family protein
VADEVKAVADEVGATPAQVAIAWLLTKGNDIAPIPGTKRVVRLEENVALHGELAPLRVSVTTVEPGAFRTDFAGRSLTQSATPIDHYAGNGRKPV